jgi:hypothetical protein
MVAATAACLAVPSSALANASSIGGGTTVNAIGSVQGGKNNQTQQYKASYTDIFFGPVACAGVHQSGKSYSPLGQDSFTCTSTTGSPLTNVYPGESFDLAYFNSIGLIFLSDYYGVQGQSVSATRLTVTVSSDGLSYTAVAGY